MSAIRIKIELIEVKKIKQAQINVTQNLLMQKHYEE